jgi:hypothetical protein
MDEHASSARPRVLYVMGAGRSGSTILGVTLGNCPGVFYAGELDAWLPRAGEPQLDGAARGAFWERVRARVGPGANDLFGHEAQVSLERSLALVRVHRWPARRRLRTAYRRVARQLYAAIAEETGGQVIVDTSHYPLRARELQREAGIELHLLYLMRDPQSVVHSFNRKDVAQYTKSTITTNVYLWLTNLLAVFVFLRQPRERRLFVRYEDFLERPADVLGDILGQVGLAALPHDLAHLSTGVAFQGNRLIRQEAIGLQRDAGRPPRHSRLTALAQLPWRPVLARLRPLAGAGGRTAAAAAVPTGRDAPAH